MGWPLVKDQQNEPYLIWDQGFAPIVGAHQIESIDDLKKILSKYQPKFPLKDTKLNLKKVQFDPLERIWKYFLGIVVAGLWFFVLVRLVQILINDAKRTGFEFPLIFFTLIALTFTFTGLWSIFSNRREKIDIIDQLNLLYFLTHEGKDLTRLDDLIIEREGRLYWKQYHPNWDISIFYPTFSLIDLFAIFVSIFSLVYIFTWMISIIQVVISSDLRNEIYLLVVDTILILTFLSLAIIGIIQGLSRKYYLTWNNNTTIKAHIVITSIAVLFVVLIDIYAFNNSRTFIFIILFSPISVISSYVANKLQFLKDYIFIRSSLLQQLEFLRISKSRASKLSPETIYHHAELRMKSQSFLPTSRIRTSLLIVTALVSVTIPILTGFISSIDRFDDFISLIWPS